MKKVYLSGPDRLRWNNESLFEEKRRLCESYGFEMMEFPKALFACKDSLENNIALAKFRLKMIEDCDLMIADTVDFRSYVEPFAETALEIGMAYAYDKKIYAYMPDIRVCKDRYAGEKIVEKETGNCTDKDGIGFEPGPVNLMLEYSCKIVEGNLEDALKAAREDFDKEDN